MAHTVESLLELFRLETGDLTEEYLWSDEEFFGFLNEAQKEFARETDYFKDVSTPELTQLPVVAGNPWVDLDTRVVEVRRAGLASRGHPLQIINALELDRQYSSTSYGDTFSLNWFNAVGTPQVLVGDLETDKLRLVPSPTQNDVLQLRIVRLPINEIENLDSALEISEDSYRRSLLMFCKAMAYEKQDTEAFDANRAAKARADFYGYCMRIKSRQTRKQRRPGTVKYGGL